MELRTLRYFFAVAEELNFTRAAARLGMQQPSLSRHIQQLEKELGTRLFRRLTRGIELTGSGKLLLEEARGILDQVERATISVRRRARGETGQIKISTAGGTQMHPLIGAIVREFRSRYPDIVLLPEADSTALSVARLHAGDLDLAFVRPPISDSGRLVLQPIIEEDMLAVLPTGHPLLGLPSVPLAKLAKETFILPVRALNPAFQDMIIKACHRAGFTPICGQEAARMTGSMMMVAAGLGISIVPRSASRLHIEGISYVALEGDDLRAPISLAYKREGSSRAVQNLVAMTRRIVRTASSKVQTRSETLE